MQTRSNNLCPIDFILPVSDTVDELVTQYLSNENDSYYDSCEYILLYCPKILLRVLTSETNKCSKFDLTFIKHIHSLMKEDLSAEIVCIFRVILNIYKNRK